MLRYSMDNLSKSSEPQSRADRSSSNTPSERSRRSGEENDKGKGKADFIRPGGGDRLTVPTISLPSTGGDIVRSSFEQYSRKRSSSPEIGGTDFPRSIPSTGGDIVRDSFEQDSRKRSRSPEISGTDFAHDGPSKRRSITDFTRPLYSSQSLDRPASSSKRLQPNNRDRISDLRGPDDRDEITPVVPSTSYRLETLSRDSMGERGSDQTNDQDTFLKALGVTEHSTLGIAEVKEYAQIIMDVVKTRGNERELLERLAEKSTQILRERDQANNREVETLLRALGIRNDDLGSENYLEARKHAQTIVRVIRTDGQDKEFNDARKALLKLAPERSWLRSWVNPKKDAIDWYSASWRNKQAMSKLDMATWDGSIRKWVYRANDPIAKLTGTRSGNLAFIGVQAVMGSLYTTYIEKKFAVSTLISTLEYATTARYFYKKLPEPINQGIDTAQFQSVNIGLYRLFGVIFPTQNTTTGG